MELTAVLKKSESNGSILEKIWETQQASVTEDNLTENLNQNSSTLDSPSSSPASPGLFSDLLQTQLALWTFTLSNVYTNLAQKRIRIRSVIFASSAVGATFFLSGVLAFLVVVAHIFSKNNFFSSSANSDVDVGGWVSPRKARSLSISSHCSDVRSRHSSGACSPTNLYKNQPIFWERKMSMEQTYFGSISSSRC